MSKSYVVEACKGVKLYFKQDYVYSTPTCFDIDVAPNIETVVLKAENQPNRNYYLDIRDVKKQFPNVKKLVIGNEWNSIRLSNMMFPNVREVESNSNKFESGPMLIYYRRYNDRYELLNTFCRDKDDVLDLAKIDTVCEFALEGCTCNNIINTDRIKRININAFAGYCPDEEADENGYYFGKNILKYIDPSAKEFEIRKDVSIISSSADFSNIDTIKVHKLKHLEMLKGRDVNKIIMDNMEDDMLTSDLIRILDRFTLGEFDIINSKQYKTVDGIIYSNDGKTLVKCPTNLLNIGEIEIAPGTEVILPNAFYSTAIESVTFPESLRTIGNGAFSFCTKQIKHVDFSKCKNLKVISDGAFSYTQVKQLTLNDGIIYIGEGAFAGSTALKKVTLPDSIEVLGERCFDSVYDVTIKGSRLTNNIISATTIEYNSRDVQPDSVVTIRTDEEEFSVPKVLSRDSICKINMQVNTNVLSDAFKLDMFECAPTTSAKQSIAVKLYDMTKNENLKSYIRKAGMSIAKHFIEKNEEELLILLLSFDVLTKNALDKTLKLANEHGMTTVSAYILKAINKGKEDKKRGTFRL